MFYHGGLKLKTNKIRCALQYFASCCSLTGIHIFSSYLYDATLITCHCLSNGWVSDYAYRNIWRMIGREQREIFNLLWLTQALNMTFLDKDYVLVNLSLALIPDPSQDFLTNHLGGKKIALYSRDQQFNLGKGGKMGRNSCCPLEKKWPESCILWYS